MIRLLLSASALTLLAGVASAADLPAYEAPVEAPVVMATPLWTGAYIGAQLGYAWGGDGDDACFSGKAGEAFGGKKGTEFDCDDYTDFTGDEFDPDGSDNDSFFAGAHIGYDHQIGSFVIGAVADVNFLFGDDDDDDDDDDDSTFDLDGLGPIVGPPDVILAAAVEEDDIIPGSFPTIAVGQGDGVDWYGTTRLRAGFAAGRFLIYGTGGLAFGETDSGDVSAFVSDDPFEAPILFEDEGEFEAACSDYDPELDGYHCSLSDDDDDGIQFGYALGAGVDFLATDNLKVGLEYLYVNLGGDDDEDEIEFFDGTTIDLNNEGSDNDFHTISVRGSYKFNLGG